MSAELVRALVESLDDATLDRIADALADRLADRIADRATPSAEGPRMVDAAELARVLGVSRDSVYENADALGAIRIGDGPRARLRFDLDRATAAHARTTTTAPTASRRRRPRKASDVALLPVKDQPTRRAA